MSHHIILFVAKNCENTLKEKNILCLLFGKVCWKCLWHSFCLSLSIVTFVYLYACFYILLSLFVYMIHLLSSLRCTYICAYIYSISLCLCLPWFITYLSALMSNCIQSLSLTRHTYVLTYVPCIFMYVWCKIVPLIAIHRFSISMWVSLFV